VDFETITTDSQLADVCRQIADAEFVGLDTEFVAEHSYRPQLCLVQLSVDGKAIIIDPLSIDNIKPLWEAIASGEHETIVHAGREEIIFCHVATNAVPRNLFDIQIAAGLIGMEYPGGYGSLSQKLLGATPSKGETRTDWRKRPLSDRQLQYAINDIVYLKPMRDQIRQKLVELKRLDWLDAELTRWVEGIRAAQDGDRWRRVSGTTNLSPRHKAIVRELWHWREIEAERRNTPPRRVLRDDLIVEMARRQTTDPKRIGALRGMDRPDLRRAHAALAECIRRGTEVPEEKLPQSRHRRQPPPQITMLGQFLASAVASLCHSADLAPSIVGNPTDVRDLIAYRLGYYHANDLPPALAVGWRAEVMGGVINDLLDGKLAIRITDPRSDEPLSLTRVDDST